MHGQQHGLWLLNTKDELGKVKTPIPNIFNKICNERTWIIVGYSGQDPIFNNLSQLGRFDNELFWIGYKDKEPLENIQNKLLNVPNTNACWISGYDADSFFLKLHSDLKLTTPDIFNRPFTFLNNIFNNIKDIDSENTVAEEHRQMFKNIRERFDTSKKWVNDAIRKYEENNIGLQLDKTEIDIDKLKQEIIEITIKEQYDKVDDIYEKVKDIEQVKELMSDLYNNWGNFLANLKDYYNSIEKFKKSILIDSKNDFALINYGTILSELAELNSDEKLLEEGISKFEDASKINPKNETALYNLGVSYYKLAKLKGDEKFYHESVQRYKEALKLNSKSHLTLSNLGLTLSDLAELKSDESLYYESIKKCREALNINSKSDKAYLNWGLSLHRLGKYQRKENLILEGIEKYEKALNINNKNDAALSNWGSSLFDLANLKNDKHLYMKSIGKFQEALKINPDNDSALINWGITLTELARLKVNEQLYYDSIEKFKEALKINPNNDLAFLNWGASLLDLAKLLNDEEKYLESIEKYKEAIKINPIGYISFINLGVVLSEFAKLKKDKKLFEEGIKKIMKAVNLRPKSFLPYNSLCTALIYYSRLLLDKEKIKILLKAKEIGQKTEALGGPVYNLACVYALLKEKEKALEYLNKSLKRGDTNINHVVTDEDWKNYSKDKDFKKIIEEYKKSNKE